MQLNERGHKFEVKGYATNLDLGSDYSNPFVAHHWRPFELLLYGTPCDQITCYSQ